MKALKPTPPSDRRIENRLDVSSSRDRLERPRCRRRQRRRLSQRLAALVNHYREGHGRPALDVDTTIASLAREHSVGWQRAQLDRRLSLARAALGICHVRRERRLELPVAGEPVRWLARFTRTRPQHARSARPPRGHWHRRGLRNDDGLRRIKKRACLQSFQYLLDYAYSRHGNRNRRQP